MHKFFHVEINVKAHHLRSDFKSITKGDKSIAEYLNRIQAITNLLFFIGEPLTHRDQLEVILDGLSDEYVALAAIVQYRLDLCPIIKWARLKDWGGRHNQPSTKDLGNISKALFRNPKYTKVLLCR